MGNLIFGETKDLNEILNERDQQRDQRDRERDQKDKERDRLLEDILKELKYSRNPEIKKRAELLEKKGFSTKSE